jgi:hypothetical protein
MDFTTVLIVWLLLCLSGSPIEYPQLVLGSAIIPLVMSKMLFLSNRKGQGVLVIMMFKMVEDFQSFLVLDCFLVVGFGAFFNGIFYNLIDQTIVCSTDILLNCKRGGILVTLLFIFLTSIIFLNLTIAHMSSIYEEVKESAEEEWSNAMAASVEQYLLVHERNFFAILPSPLNLFIAVICPFQRIHDVLYA